MKKIFTILFCFTSILFSQVPTITSFTPTSGAIGSTVTITGSNFSSTIVNNIVWFGGVRATVTSATATQLQVTVPLGANNPIKVLVNNLFCEAQKSFITTFIGGGNYENIAELITGKTPKRVAIADLDGDGNQDIVVTNYESNTISIYRNKSTDNNLSLNSFSPKVDITTGSNPENLKINDIDLDGKLDLIIVNLSSSTFSIIKNNSVSGSLSVNDFQQKVDFTTNAHPMDLVVCDLDNDGKPDIATANSGSTQISIFKNISQNGLISSSSFSSKVDIEIGKKQYGIASSDLDGDGKIDLAITNDTNKVSVIRNVASTGIISSFSFESKIDYTVGSGPTGIKVGDLNDDNKPEIIVANHYSNCISILENISSKGVVNSSSFSTKVDFITDSAPMNIIIHDIDGDKKSDIVVSNFSANSVTMLNNQNKNSISSLSFKINNYFFINSAPMGIAISDLNNNGKPDLIVANLSTNKISVFNNIDFQTPTITSFFPTIGSIGSKIIIQGSNLNGLKVVSVGGFEQSSYRLIGEKKTGIELILGNIKTGKILISTPGGIAISNDSLIFYPTPKISTILPKSGPIGTSVTLKGENFNKSISKNIVWFGGVKANVVAVTETSLVVEVPKGATNPIKVLANGLATKTRLNFNVTFNSKDISLKSFASKMNFNTGDGPEKIVIGDFNLDGKNDIAIINWHSNIVSIYRNTAKEGILTSNSFADKINFSVGNGPSDIAIADFEGDGDLDLAITNYNSNSISILRNYTITQDTILRFQLNNDELKTGKNPNSISVDDIDNDGKNDIIVTNFGDKSISVFRNITNIGWSMQFEKQISLNSYSEPQRLVVGDIDGDEKLDLVITNGYTNSISIFKNTSVAGAISVNSFAEPVMRYLSYPTKGVELADLNGDNKLDLIVIPNGSYYNFSIFKNQATIGIINSNSFSENITVQTKSNPSDVIIHDLNGDSKPDIVILNRYQSSFSFYKNITINSELSSASFANQIDFDTYNSNSFLIFDFDLDDKPDIALTNGSTMSFSILKNREMNVNPINQSFGNASPITFRWEKDNSATIYKLKVSTADNLIPTSIISIENADTFFTIINLKKSTKYFWEVISESLNTKKAWVFRSFTTKLDLPEIITPLNNEMHVGLRPLISWKMISIPGLKYSLQISKDSNFTNIYFNYTASFNYLNSILMDSLQFGIKYYMRLKCYVDNDTSDWALGSFNTISNFPQVPILIYPINLSSNIIINDKLLWKRDENANYYNIQISRDQNFSILFMDHKKIIDTFIVASIFYDSNTTYYWRVNSQNGNYSTGFSSPFKFTTGASTNIPSISSFTPISGPIGTTVTITGINFGTTDDDKSVWFGNAIAKITSFSSNSIKVIVPPGAGNPIRVNINGMITEIQNKFNVVFMNGVLSSKSLSKNIDFIAGMNPNCIAIADIDGDGKKDIAVLNNYSQSISFYRNLSASGSINSNSFSEKEDLKTDDSYPNAISFADLDGDNKLDLIISSSCNISIYKNISHVGSITTNSFSKSIINSVAFCNSNKIIVCDIDLDGKLDIIIHSITSNSFSIIKNMGSIRKENFSKIIEFKVDEQPTDFNVGDFDNDGKADIVVYSHNQKTLALYKNISILNKIDNTSFTNKIVIASNIDVRKIKIEDIDLDNKLDFICTTAYGAYIFKNVSNYGNLNSNSFLLTDTLFSIDANYSLETSDLDGDRKPEIILSGMGAGQINIFKNINTNSVNQKRNFIKSYSLFFNGQVRDLVCDDLNGDGAKDLLFTNPQYNKISILVNLASKFPTFIDFSPKVGPTGTLVKISGKNFSIDNSDNIVWFGQVKSKTLVSTDSTILVEVPKGASNPIRVVINGITLETEKKYLLTFNNGSISVNSFVNKINLTTGGSPIKVILADINNDEKHEIITLNELSKTFSIFKNTTTKIDSFSFASKVDFYISRNPYELSISDLDGDSKLDMIISMDNNLSVFQNSTSHDTISLNSFSNEIDLNYNDGSKKTLILDLNKDGNLDIINYSGQSISYIQNNSTVGSIRKTSFANPLEFIKLNNPTDIEINDLDGDSKLDLVVIFKNLNLLSIYKNNSNDGIIDENSFISKIDYTTNDKPSDIEIVDLDGDNKSEIIVANEASKNISVYKNTSIIGNLNQNSFNKSFHFSTNISPRDVELNDLDGDEKLDLIIRSYGSQTISILKNNSFNNQIDSTSFLKIVALDAGTIINDIKIGDLNFDSKPEIITINSNSNSVTVFRNNGKVIHKLTANKFGNGTITPLGDTLVAHGDSLRYKLIANAGYHIFRIIVDSILIIENRNIKDTIYTFRNIDRSHSINVIFRGEPLIKLLTTKLDFGNVKQTSTKYSSFSIKNDGNDTLKVKFISTSTLFTITNPQIVRILNQNNEIKDSIKFSPDPLMLGNAMGKLYIESNHLNQPTKDSIELVANVITKIAYGIDIPKVFSINQNYPNPFNPATTIRFGLPKESFVKLEIYNLLGQLVQTLINEKLEARYYETKWEAGNIPTGLFFYKIIAVEINDPQNKFIETKKMMLVK